MEIQQKNKSVLSENKGITASQLVQKQKSSFKVQRQYQ